MFRVGQGLDIHPIAPGRQLVLGGVAIPWELGLAGHSDADVLLHAVIDAVLGALGAGDIGQWFPPGDPAWAGADSRHLLRLVLAGREAVGWHLLNLDATVVTEAPRLVPHVPAMRESIAALFGVPPTRISVKATTSEGLGFIGRAEGMAALAVVLLGATPCQAAERQQGKTE